MKNQKLKALMAQKIAGSDKNVSDEVMILNRAELAAVVGGDITCTTNCNVNVVCNSNVIQCGTLTVKG